MNKEVNKRKAVEKPENNETAKIEVELFCTQTDASDVDHVELGDDVFNVPSSTSEPH